jgi:tetratricopeptide (TPR) repeat protein
MNILDSFQGTKQMRTIIIKSLFVITLGVSAWNFAVMNAVAGNAGADLKEISLLSEQGNQAAALEKVNAYLNANPKDAEAMFMKGVILVELGKRDEAIKAFTDLTEKYPNLPEPYNNLAVLYADQGQYDKARKALETAIKTHPSYDTAHENLGDIYARLASEAYDKAFKLDTSNARAQGKLSMITDLFGGKASANKPAVASKDTTKSVEMPKPATTTKLADGKKPEAAKQDMAKLDVKPEPTKPVASAGNDESAVLDAVNVWAKAWSDQNVDQYLASYADSFKTPKGESRKAWENTRRDRVSRPKSIAVEVNNPKVMMESADVAKVQFNQRYIANGKPQGTRKTLNMVKVNGNWLIEQEIAGR